jgi:chromosomal replication initiation ATPase DnaA
LTVRQFTLPFAREARFAAADFLESESNAEARAWLERTEDWPSRRLALCGERGVGKTHLLHIWADRQGATLLSGASLRGDAPLQGPLAIDDADQAAAETLLHVLNFALEAGHPVLLAAVEPPARWDVALADLSSRLRAILAVSVAPPEETLLRALLMRHLAARQLAVPEAVQEWMLTRLPRTPDALREAAWRFDEASLGDRGAPRAIAARVVQAMRRDGEGAVGLPSDDEDFAQVAGLASREGRRLL